MSVRTHFKRLVRRARRARRPPLLTNTRSVIVADIGMADEDGYALLRSLRHTEQEQRLPRVPAVAMTAFVRRQDRQSVGGRVR